MPFSSDHRQEVDEAFGRALVWRVASDRMHEIEVRRPARLERRDDWPELFAWVTANEGHPAKPYLMARNRILKTTDGRAHWVRVW